jgi:thiosulfate/3-mercaptopyruvate sulfurtransferase
MEMPPVDSLAHLFGGLGVTPTSHVVLYAQMLPMATRALVTLEYAGVRNVSLLDGGVTRWTSEHRPLTDVAPKLVATRFAPNPNREIIASADWVRGKLSKPGVSLIDTRTDPEYNGGGERHGGTSTGHLPGARQLQWEQLTAAEGPVRAPSPLRRARHSRRHRGHILRHRVPGKRDVFRGALPGLPRQAIRWLVRRVVEAGISH